MGELPKLIALCDRAMSGKDSVAQILGALNQYKRVAFADPVKFLASKIGWDGSKQKDGRLLLQKLGMGVREILGENSWVDLAMSKVDGYLSQGYKVVITDLRMMNEVVEVKKRGGKIIRVVCSTRGLQGEAAQDVSEISQEMITKPDWTIVNDSGIEDLILMVEEAMCKLS